MRGVTDVDGVFPCRLSISTRTPHAGSDIDKFSVELQVMISTRTPHAGSDDAELQRRGLVLISTRTPHAGSDTGRACWNYEKTHFNPHSPCGE